MPSDRGLIYLVKQVEMAVRRRLMETVAASGLNYAQYTALAVLRRRPGITSSELARRSFVRPQSMAATLVPLVEAGYARRENDPEHGRQILLYITDAGVAKVEAMSGDVRALEDRMVANLDADEIEEFARLLRASRDAMQHPEPTRPTRVTTD